MEIDFEFDKIVKPKPKKYGLESCGWVCLVLSGATCFAACNLVMVSLSEHGMRTQFFYYNTGSAVVATIYFT